MAEPRLRVRLPAGGNSGQALSVVTDDRDGSNTPNTFLAKEYSITDDVLNVSDTATVTIANDDGENSGKFFVGQRIEIDESDPDVANGQWVRHFTGRITKVATYSDQSGGSNIMLTAMDLGWHLTSCHGEPLRNIKGIRFSQLIDLLIDPTWGFGATQFSGDRNTRLKHGRQIIIQNFKPVLGAVLPFIQVEPGQTPFDILRLYAAREGLLINVGARGELILFRPDYTADALYRVEYHSSREDQRDQNNIEGRAELSESIDEVYSEVECWSTVVIPPEIQNTENPNEAYRHDRYKPSENPLPFRRRHVFSDGEAINQKLRKNRAIWKQQLGEFNSWTYEVEFNSHSQVNDKGQGAFFVSNTMISINDTVNKVQGAHYVQAVRRSVTSQGTRARLTIRLPGKLNPDLNALKLGGGARRAAKAKKAVS